MNFLGEGIVWLGLVLFFWGFFIICFFCSWSWSKGYHFLNNACEILVLGNSLLYTAAFGMYECIHPNLKPKEALKCMTVRVLKKTISKAQPLLFWGQCLFCWCFSFPISLSYWWLCPAFFSEGGEGRVILCWLCFADLEVFVCTEENWTDFMMIPDLSVAMKEGRTQPSRRTLLCFGFVLPWNTHSATVAEALVVQAIPSYPDVRLKWE